MAKLVKCKICGAEIAKTAKTCPNCGANQHKGATVAFVVIVIVTIILVISVLSGGEGEDNTGVADSQQGNSSTISESSNEAANDAEEEMEVISVTAEDLYSAYEENSVNADNLYKGNIVSVTGVVSNIGQDIITKKPCVSLDSGDEFGLYPVQCFFSDSSDALANLRDGDIVTIVGKCTGYSVTNVQLTNCELLTTE